jgi:hypothetical protein
VFGPPLTEFLLQRFPLDGWSLPSHIISLWCLVTLNPMVEADVLPFQIVSDLSPRILGPSPLTPAAAMGHELGNELFAVAPGLTLSWLGNPRTKWMFQRNIIHK